MFGGPHDSVLGSVESCGGNRVFGAVVDLQYIRMILELDQFEREGIQRKKTCLLCAKLVDLLQV